MCQVNPEKITECRNPVRDTVDRRFDKARFCFRSADYDRGPRQAGRCGITLHPVGHHVPDPQAQVMGALGQSETVWRQTEPSNRLPIDQQLGDVPESRQFQKTSGGNIDPAKLDHRLTGIEDLPLLFPSLRQAQASAARRQREPGFFRFIDVQRILFIYKTVIIAGSCQRDIEPALKECRSGELRRFFQLDRVFVRGGNIEPAVVIAEDFDPCR